MLFSSLGVIFCATTPPPPLVGPVLTPVAPPAPPLGRCCILRRSRGSDRRRKGTRYGCGKVKVSFDVQKLMILINPIIQNLWRRLQLSLESLGKQLYRCAIVDEFSN